MVHGLASGEAVSPCVDLSIPCLSRHYYASELHFTNSARQMLPHCVFGYFETRMTFDVERRAAVASAKDEYNRRCYDPRCYFNGKVYSSCCSFLKLFLTPNI